MMLTAIPVKKEAMEMKKPASAAENTDVRMNIMAGISARMPSRGTATRLAIRATAETRLK